MLYLLVFRYSIFFKLLIYIRVIARKWRYRFFFFEHLLDDFSLELGTVLLPRFLLHNLVYTFRADKILSEILGSLYPNNHSR
jgi:hypothetical protein